MYFVSYGTKYFVCYEDRGGAKNITETAILLYCCCNNNRRAPEHDHREDSVADPSAHPHSEQAGIVEQEGCAELHNTRIIGINRAAIDQNGERSQNAATGTRALTGSPARLSSLGASELKKAVQLPSRGDGVEATARDTRHARPRNSGGQEHRLSSRRR